MKAIIMFFTILTMLKSNGRDAINSFKYTQTDYKPLLSLKGDTSAYILYNFVENQNQAFIGSYNDYSNQYNDLQNNPNSSPSLSLAPLALESFFANASPKC